MEEKKSTNVDSDQITVNPKTEKSKQDKTVKKDQNKSTKIKKMVVALMVGALAMGYAGGYYGAKNQNSQNNTNQSSRQVIDSESNLISNIAKDVGESVVSINVQSKACLLYTSRCV